MPEINLNKVHWWKPIESEFQGLSLKGIKVKCPDCNEQGYAITRWKKGTYINPIFIHHIKWNKTRKICELNEKQESIVRNKVKLLDSDIKKILRRKKPYILFSGGKDSLATLIKLKQLIDKPDDITALFVDTTAGLPENTKYVRKICDHLNLELKIVKPHTDFFTLARKWGIPSYGFRWCCRELKIKPIRDFLNTKNSPKVVIDGIRAAESYLRRQYIPIWYHPTFKCISVSLIFYWSDQQVLSSINNNGIPKSLLHTMLNTSTECWCGAYKTESDFKKLYKLNRDMFYKLAEIEEESQNRYTFIYKKGQKVPLKELERKVLKERKYNSRNKK